MTLVILVNNSLLFSQENLIFIGHAYGSHLEKDKNIDPVIVQILNEKNKLEIDEFVFGGDFIYNCNDEQEVNNLFHILNEFKINLVIGNHDDCSLIKNYLFNKKKGLNYSRIYQNNLLLYLNTSISTEEELKQLENFILGEINKNNPSNVLIFCHQSIFSKNDFYLRTNSRKFYSMGNKLYKFLKDTFYDTNKDLYLFTGDIGAFDYTPYSYYEKDKNFNLYAVGLGNTFHKNVIEISVGAERIVVNFIDLDKKTIISPKNFNKLKVRLYQFPKLFFNRLKLFFKQYSLYIIIFFGIILLLNKKNEI